MKIIRSLLMGFAAACLTWALGCWIAAEIYSPMLTQTKETDSAIMTRLMMLYAFAGAAYVWWVVRERGRAA